MAFTYQTAPTVSAGDRPTSAQWNALAKAFNDRLENGVGDPTRRMWYKAGSVFRNIRTSDGTIFPSVDEWFSHYMHIDPTVAGSDFEPDNSALNPMLAFVLGSGTYFQDAETRLNSVPVGYLPLTPVEAWELGKAQRGAVDLTTGAEGSPVMAAARSYLPTVWANQMFPWSTGYTPYLRKYGGVYPIVLASGSCADTISLDEEGNYVLTGESPNYRLRFRALDGSGTLSFNTHCRYESVDPGTGVGSEDTGAWQLFRETEDAYEVQMFGGVVRRLSKSEYILDPGTAQAALMHTDAWALTEFLQRYGSEFRGTEAERSDDDYSVRELAFDFQRFFEGYYRLAPAMGSLSGDSVEAVYPFCDLSDHEYAPGDKLRWNNDDGIETYTIPNGDLLVVHGCLATANGLAEAVTVRVESPSTGQVFGTVAFNAGDNSHVVWFEEPASVSDLCVTIVSGSVTDGTETPIRIEFAILRKQKPSIADAYVLMRLATTQGGTGSLETIGQNVNGKQAAERFFQYSVIIADTSVPVQVFVEDNPIYETARRMLRERMRLYKRQSFQGYEVTADGDSVLYFARYLTIGGEQFDAWEGLAPPAEAIASGAIQAGITYRVNGSVTYNGVAYADETFVGISGVPTFVGTGEVFQQDGIMSSAPEKGLSNEWLMFVTSNCYNDSESSPFKPDNYGDVVSFLNNRAHFLSSGLTDTDLCDHAAYGLCNPPTHVEAMTAHNYWARLNANDEATDADKRKFYKSCPMYPADYKVRSVTYNRDTQEVAVTFHGRLRWHPNSDVDGALSRAAAGSLCPEEDYRTDENTLRNYLHYAAGNGACPTKIGDAAELKNPLGFGAHGSCHPRFYFTRKVPLVRVDVPTDNDTQEQTDTRMFATEMQWLTWTLDAICEGFLDNNGTAQFSTCASRPMHYRMETLCVEAFNRHSPGLFPADVNENNGSGPYPNTNIYSELFNNIASAVNKLTRAPVELPFAFEKRTRRYVGTHAIEATSDAGEEPAGQPCGPATTGDSGHVSGDHPNIEAADIAEVSTAEDLTWVNASAAFNASASASIDYETLFGPSFGFKLACVNGVSSYQLRSTMAVDEFRLKDPQPYLEAVADITDMFEENLSIVATVSQSETSLENTFPVGTQPAIVLDTISFHFDGIAYTSTTETEQECRSIPLGSGAIFSLLGSLNEPGYVIPSSFYWAMLESSGQDGVSALHANGGATRSVTATLSDTAIAIVSVPLSE